MEYLQIVIAFIFWLPFYFLPFYILTLILRTIGVSERWRVFFSISIMGIALGFLTSLSSSYREFWFNFNMPGMMLGDELNIIAMNRFADPHSFYGSFAVPWILRIPQIYLITTAPIWSLFGLVAQFIYSSIKKPAPFIGTRTMIVALSLIACFCLSFGAVYGLQDDAEKFRPTEPTVTPIMEVILPSFTTGTPPLRPPPPVTYDQTTTYAVENLALSKKVIEVGDPLEASAMITNNGPGEGMA